MNCGLSEVESDILSRRHSPDPETLDQIAKDYGLSRERIRQLQVQGERSLRRSSVYKTCREAATLVLKMKGYLTCETASRCASQGQPEIESYMRAAVGTIVFGDVARGRSDLYGGAVIRDRQIRIAIDHFQHIVNRATIDQPSSTVDEIVNIAISDSQYARLSVWVKEVISDLWPILRGKAENKLSEVRRNATAANLAHDVIREAGRPLHWTVVGPEVNRRRERIGLGPLSENGTHNRMQSMKDLFSYAGQGTYGLREWGPDVPFVRNLLIDVVESAGRPMTMTEIANLAGKERDVNEASLTLYLSLDPDFYFSRSGKYGLTEWLDPSPTIRTSRDYVRAFNDREKRLKSVFAKQRQ